MTDAGNEDSTKHAAMTRPAPGNRSRYGTTKTMFVPGLSSLRACP